MNTTSDELDKTQQDALRKALEEHLGWLQDGVTAGFMPGHRQMASSAGQQLWLLLCSHWPGFSDPCPEEIIKEGKLYKLPDEGARPQASVNEADYHDGGTLADSGGEDG